MLLPKGLKSLLEDSDSKVIITNSSLAKTVEEIRAKLTHVIRGNSHSPRTLRELQSVLNGAKVDLIFIDGDHTYSGVKRDFINILPLMARNGAMAFHDISAIKIDYHIIEVSRFWAEVKRCYRHHEFVDRETPLGIGVLLV